MASEVETLVARLRTYRPFDEWCEQGVHHYICTEAADAIAFLTAERDALAARVRAFLAKWDECEPHVTDAFMLRELRCGPYTGPQFGEELAALRDLLQAGREG